MGRLSAIMDYLAEMTPIHALRLPSYLSKLYRMNNCIVFEKCRWLQEILKRLSVNEKHYAAIPTQPIPSRVHELTTTPSISVLVFHFFLDPWKIMWWGEK